MNILGIWKSNFTISLSEIGVALSYIDWMQYLKTINQIFVCQLLQYNPVNSTSLWTCEQDWRTNNIDAASRYGFFCYGNIYLITLLTTTV